MRILRYRLELSTFGYSVVSGSKDIGDGGYGDDCQPIKVVVSTLRFDTGTVKLKDILDSDSFDLEDSAYVLQHYEEILRGEDGTWMVSGFTVEPHALFLIFYNRMLKDVATACISDPYLLNFQFDVPGQKNNCPVHYSVELSKHSDTYGIYLSLATISEIVEGHKYCEISMYKRSDSPSDIPQYADITEYSNL